ncbi:MAG TPA: hypothetical protein PK926_15135 [Spirochaetota bacterium]|nr:hypothetical protein [Spirochaetota bacterium]HPI89828.1 hypothetical protein [Spirochaetota bacterium]HPR49398.1 hypothetical protein [Spirochaetota bacterium]
MPRAKIWGFLALIFSLSLLGFFIYSIFLIDADYPLPLDLAQLNAVTYYSVAVPLAMVSLFVVGVGFWIGWTIITIKVVPPMPEIVEKKDYSKIKAVVLCIITLTVALLMVYGVYLRAYWALAIPAMVISLVVLGAIFWVGIAIVTTRSTLPK